MPDPAKFSPAMAKTKLAADGSDALGRARLLAEKMARVLSDENVADTSVALALLASGVVEFYAEDLTHARHMLGAIRDLEDSFVQAAMADETQGKLH
jgi:hypothetical protein